LKYSRKCAGNNGNIYIIYIILKANSYCAGSGPVFLIGNSIGRKTKIIAKQMHTVEGRCEHNYER